MKRLTPRFIEVVIVCLLMVVVMTIISRSSVTHSQVPCVAPPLLGISVPKWRTGLPVTPVTVVFATSTFTTDEIRAIQRAFTNWNNKNGVNGNLTGVNFIGFETGPAPNVDTAFDTYYIRKAPPSEFVTPVGFANALTFPNSSSVSSFDIGVADTKIRNNINWTQFDSDAWSLTETMAHEIGHTFRLNDVRRQLFYPLNDN